MATNSPFILERLVRGVKEKGIGSLGGKAFRLLRRLWRQTRFKPYSIARAVGDRSFQLHIGDISSEDWYASESSRMNVQERDWLRDHIQQGDFVLDCGAHHGIISLLASKWVGPGGKVLTVEALPHNAKVITTNIELNNVGNVTVVNKAAGSSQGVLHVEYKKFGFLFDSNGMVRDAPHKGTVEVPSIALDELIESRMPNLLKVDVEGHEIEVLKGAKRILASAPALDLEIHCGLWEDPLPKVRALMALLPLDRYEGMIQLDPHGELIEFLKETHSAEVISSHENAHLFLSPRTIETSN